MALYHEYRPKRLEDVVGNESIIKSIKSLFERDKKDIPHAFLFSGPSGCGKTTIGRIIKDMLKCSDYDFMEINASNSRGIETSREIMRIMNLSPMNGDVRVFLIDEVHMITKEFQNSILKALEDTPDHVYFILCTTEPNRLLKTVRNRCTQYEVDKLSENQMEDLINDILDSEGVEDFPDKVFDTLIENSDGCARQALVILDKIIDLEADEMIKVVDTIRDQESQTIELCRALLKQQSWDIVSSILKKLNEDPERIRQAILGYINAVALKAKDQNTHNVCLLIYQCFKEPLHYNGKSGLTMMALDYCCG